MSKRYLVLMLLALGLLGLLGYWFSMHSPEDGPAVASLEPGSSALAEDLADDSYGERLLGKLRGLVSLRRVGDVPGDTTEAKLARAEQALHAGDVTKAAELVKALPASTNKATAAWLQPVRDRALIR